MSRSSEYASRFREVILDGKWIANTNLKELLSDIGYEQAMFQREDLNSIASLTFHMGYYIEGVLNVFEGGTLDIRDKYSFDLPSIESEKDWSELKERVWSHSERFAACVEVMSEEKLNAAFVDEKYGTYGRNIEGMIEHCYYHLGQIALLKKMGWE